MNLNIKALNFSVILTLVLIAVMTVLSELSPAFKAFLANLLWHHWVAKGIGSLIFFILVYFLLNKIIKEENPDVRKEMLFVVLTAIICGLVIFGFYVWHFSME